MTDHRQRIAELSPRKRELLLRLLEARAQDNSRRDIRRQSRDTNTFPLSFGQQRLWFLDQAQPGSSFYNLPMAVRVCGRLDPAILERSINEIVGRHETLRTTFQIVDGLPMQVIAAELRVPLRLIDVRETEVRRLMTEDALQPFDLAHGPLLRTSLLRLGAAEHVFLFTIHHIISDGWSTGVFIHEMAALCDAFSSGKPSPLTELAIQYADYSVWQREWLQGEVLENQLSYWKQQLSDLPLLEFPADRPRPAVQTFRGRTRYFALPEALTGPLRTLSREEGATLLMTLLAAFQTLLSRYTGQVDVVVGAGIAGRNRVETESLIGFFVNMLVMRTDLSRNPTFRELLGRVRSVAVAAYERQDLPFEQLVEELQPERDLSRHPLFQIAFVLQNTPVSAIELRGLSLTPIPSDAGSSRFDLTLYMTEAGDVLSGAVEYNTDLFEAETIRRMALHFEQLLEGIAANPDRHLSELPLIREAERHQLLDDWNGRTLTVPDESCVHQAIHHAVEQQAERTPEAVAVVSGERRWTYRELNDESNRLARHLESMGVGPETVVAVYLDRSLELIAALLAVLKAGGAYLPLDASSPPERIAYMLADARAKVLLTEEPLVEKLAGHSAGIVCLTRDRTAWAEQSPANVASRVTQDNLAYVIYTSGSTGQPKGVAVPHGGLMNLVAWHRREYNVTPEDRATQVAGLSFDASVWEMWPYLASGASLYLAAEEVRVDPAALVRWMAAEAITLAFLPTPIAEAVLAERWPSGEQKGRLRALLTGGDRLHRGPGGDVEFAVVNHYGPTENSVVTTCGRVEEGQVAPPIGRPIANTRVYVLDGGMELAPIGVPGELYIGGAQLARGYVGRAEWTAERFIPDAFGEEAGGRLYRTGDRVRWNAAGEIEFVGRIDQQVKVRGYRIELGEVEAALAQHEGVAESVVITREETVGDRRLVAYVVPREAGRISLVSELRGYLGERLPEYMVPSGFVMMEALPLTTSGKVDRRALPSPDGQRVETTQAHTAPRNPVEEVLSGIWSDVLHTESVGIHDNFFERGGHSLLATQVMSRVRDAFHAELPLRTLFESPTVAGLAAAIEVARRNRRGLQSPQLLLARRDGPVPLSFAQQRLWFLNQMEPGIPAYNILSAVRLNGPLSKSALEQSLNEVIRRHESLRTTFNTVEGRALQLIAADVAVQMTAMDLRQTPEVERDSELRRLSAEEAQRVFDLSTGPLIRATLLELDDQDHVLLITIHHIVADGWSMGVFLREVVALYQAFAAGRPSPLPRLPIQYADFAVWQREFLQGDVLEAELAYWRDQLGGLPLLQLPTDRPRPAVQTFQGATCVFELPDVLAESLNALSRRTGATLFMTLLAAFKVLLHRYSAQDEVVVGTGVANRNRSEVEGLIGFFVNMLVLRTDVSGNPTFRELLGRVRNVTLNAYDHQDLPFEKLVEELQPERDLARQPLFQVACVLQNTPLPAVGLSELTIRPLELETGSSKFDLTLFLWEAAGRGVTGAFEYNTQLFDASTIARMAGHLRTLLESIAADPEQRIADLALIGGSERQQLLTAWNETAAAYPADQSIHGLFEEQVKRTPEATAAVSGAESLSYRELNRRANQLACYLQHMGVGPEVVVGICIERSLELVVALLGVLKAGGAYLPLDPAYPRERLGFMVSDSRTKVLLTTKKLAAVLPEHEAAIVYLDAAADAIAAQYEGNPDSGVRPENLAYVIYTSGSTGQPKGTLAVHRGLCNLIQAQRLTFALPPQSCVLQFSSFSFDAATFEVLLAFGAGAAVCLYTQDAVMPGLPLLELLEKESLTTAVLPPSVLATLRPADLPMLRTLIVAGEACSAELVMQWAPRRRFFNAYGPTEGSIWATVLECTGDSGRVSIGRPIANAQIYVLDRYLQPVPAGVPGELLIGGAGLARGYLYRPELTAERFVPHPFHSESGARLYRTGDLARWLPDGTIEFLGRIDHQVKVRGFRIELEEIESVLARHPGVRECVVVAREDTPADRRLVAYVVTQDAGKDEQAEQVDHWQRLYDDTYSSAQPSADPTFNIAGWNSSYTGEALPEAAMREWVDQTVARILALRPRRVLEVGCGSGLLLFRIAQHTDKYVGTDFSRAALDYVEKHLDDRQRERVELRERRADDFADLERESFDCVIVNSVVQYFPGIEYLMRVLESAIQVVAPGGAIFLGDLRSLPLLEPFHAAVQAAQSREDTTREELRQRVLLRMEQEQELAIDPALFSAMADRIATIGSVDVLPKHGQHRNELTQFRYDVVLHIGARDAGPKPVAWRDWQQDGLSVPDLREMLRSEQPESVALCRVPNERVQAAVETAAWMKRNGDPVTLGEFRLTQQNVGVDPEVLWRLSGEFPYDVSISWADTDATGRFDVLLVRRTGMPSTKRSPFPGARAQARPWTSYANRPVGRQTKQEVPELRRYLEEKLPQYMVPAAFVVLDRLPLTPNGKIDRKALPAPGRVRPEMAEAYVAPRTAVEERLASIWSQVLGVDQVGIRDSFFALGGDSILSIQVVARANQAGIKLTPKQLFQNQTIAELAAVADTVAGAAAEQGLVTGPLLLTPIQQWFFEQQLTNSHHFNQALLFEVYRPLDAERLKTAVQHLLQHHDALRLRFVRERDEWRAFHAEAGGQEPFERYDLSDLAVAAQNAAVEKTAEALQGSLNLAGPMMRVALFDLGPARQRLLIVIHHLVVDGVSWRILLEDLPAAYGQLARGQEVSLPPKTASLQAWSQVLHQYAQSAAVANESGYWLSATRRSAARLPLDENLGANTVASRQSVVMALEPEETRELLSKAPQAYRTRINDVLLAAMAQAMTQWTASQWTLIDLEGHGREEIAEGIDVSRTVGWFTTLFPVVLEVSNGDGPAETLKSIKEQLRAVPRNGIGYGLLRYSREDKTFAEQLSNLPAAEIVFNYLGQVGQAAPEQPLFGLAPESSGPVQSLEQQRRHLLEISAIVAGGRLQVTWMYSRNVHRDATIERLADRFVRSLRALIAHCVSPEAGGYTPSDFPEAELAQHELDLFTSPISAEAKRTAIEAIYPLSPLQQGLLFHSLYAPKDGLYFEQVSCVLAGRLNVTAFTRAWQEVVNRHGALRTSLHWKGLARLLQVVHERVELPFDQRDWRDLAGTPLQDGLDAYMRADRQRGFDLTVAPLMRIALHPIAEDAFQFIWSFHHVLLEGWSVSLVLKEVFALYETFSKGETVYLPPLRPYRDYIAWLREQDRAGAEVFWRETLRGFTASTPLPYENRDTYGRPNTEESFNESKIPLSAESVAAIQSFAQQQQLTLNTLVQGAWALLLSRCSGASDVVFGTTVSGRSPSLAGVEGMVGLLINTLPVRVEIRPEARLRSWLKDLQARLADMRQYEYSPLVDINRWSGVPRGLPLFESLVVFENYPVDASLGESRSDLHVRAFYAVERFNYPLTLFAGPGMGLRVLYHGPRFEHEAVERLLGDLRTILEQMANDPEQQLAGFLPASPVRTAALFQETKDRPWPYVAPGNAMEEALVKIWCGILNLERVGIHDNFFEMGGHSLVAMTLMDRVCTEFSIDLPLRCLFESPTIAGLAASIELERADDRHVPGPRQTLKLETGHL